MDRRIFLASLGGGMIGGAATKAQAQPLFADGPMVRTYVTNVAETIGDRPLPKPGERLRLRVDPSRTYDPHTLVVTTADGASLGYLPPIHGRIIEPLVSSGFVASAWVETSRGTPRPALRIALNLHPRATGDAADA